MISAWVSDRDGGGDRDGSGERPSANADVRHGSPVACLLVPHFALRVALLDRPEMDGFPLVLGPPAGGRAVVLDASPEAAARGIRPGLSLREAGALCPQVVVLTPDPAREAATAEEILTALEALSPLVEPDALAAGTWYVDLRGLERHLGPPREAATRLLGAPPPHLRARVGVASGKFAARVAAGRAAPGGVHLVASGGPPATRAFLAGEGIRWLPLPPETVGRLELMGLRTLGDLAALPGAAVAARFGPPGHRAWELARGQDGEPVRPRHRVEVASERLELPAPATSRETFLLALRRLIKRAFGRPILRGRGARRARLRVLLEGGGSWEKAVAFKAPSGEARLAEALRLRFGSLELPGPVETLELELSGLTAEAVRQEAFAGLRPGRPLPLVEAARQLKVRYGASPLYRVVEVEPWSRIPERRHALIRFDP
jgi:nucleotidyltransferase/DNA polymerase involved in DNA repair